MKITNINCLISAINEKVNSNTNKPYWQVSIVSLDGEGTALNINVKDKDIVDKFEIMNRYKVNMSLSNSQYGIKIEFDSINPIVEELGSVI